MHFFFEKKGLDTIVGREVRSKLVKAAFKARKFLSVRIFNDISNSMELECKDFSNTFHLHRS